MWHFYFLHSAVRKFLIRTALIRGPVYRPFDPWSTLATPASTGDKLSGVCELRERASPPSCTRGGREHELPHGFYSFTTGTCKRAALHARTWSIGVPLGQCAVFPGKKLRFQLLRGSAIIFIVPIIVLFIRVPRVAVHDRGSDEERESECARSARVRTIRGAKALLNVVSRVITYNNWILRKITI